MLAQMLLLAMDRDKIFRLDDPKHQLLLLLAGMAGNMNVIHLFINNFRSQLHQLVDYLADRFSLPGIGFAEIITQSFGQIETFR